MRVFFKVSSAYDGSYLEKKEPCYIGKRVWILGVKRSGRLVFVSGSVQFILQQSGRLDHIDGLNAGNSEGLGKRS